MGTSTRLSSAPEVFGRAPVWSPSGDEIAFGATRQGGREIFVRPANAGRESRAIKGTVVANSMTFDWSPDGRVLLYGDGVRIRRADPSGDAEPKVFLESNFRQRWAQFSPDGRYVAYCSYEAGSWEVYVTSFPDREFRATISRGGGLQPRWSRDGKEIFYVANDRDLMAVRVSSAEEFSFGRAKKLFAHPGLEGELWDYDVRPDGRFLLIEPADAGDSDRNPPSIYIVENWYEEFRDREQN